MSRRVAPTVLMCAVLLAGCGADDPLQDNAGLSVTATPAGPSDSPTPEPTSEESGLSEIEPIESPGTEVPEPIEVAQGDEVYGVYLAVAAGASSTAETDVAEADAVRNGWLYSSGELGCDMGAARALGLGEGEYFRVAVYFSTEADARAFADAYSPGAEGVGQVTLFCLD
ncbi:MAG: hypothetical protein ACT4PP_07980 [Sporichthyaceae bacterium]